MSASLRVAAPFLPKGETEAPTCYLWGKGAATRRPSEGKLYTNDEMILEGELQLKKLRKKWL